MAFAFNTIGVLDPTLIEVFAESVPVAILSAVKLPIYAESKVVIDTDEVVAEDADL